MKLSAIGITPQKEKQFNGKGIFSVEDLSLIHISEPTRH